MTLRYPLLVWALTFSACIQAQGLSFREIPSREGVRQKFVYQKVPDAAASTVLLQGGGGSIGTAGSEERGWVKIEAFLSGGVGRFAEQGVSAAAVDAPSDKLI